MSSASRAGDASAAFSCARRVGAVRAISTPTARAKAAGTMKDNRHAAPWSSGLEASPLATMATPMPDHTGEPAAERLSGSVASKTMRKIENTPKPAATPATKRPAAIVAMSEVSPQTSIAQANTKWLPRHSARARTFVLSEGDASVPSR